MKQECSRSNDRKAHHSEELKLDMIKRLNKIEGQVRGVGKMIRDDVYCDNVLNQITAVTAALNGVRKLLLENHIKSCVVAQLDEGKLEVVDELMTTIGRMVG